MKKQLLILTILSFCLVVSTATAQSGGTFTITQSVIAAGGGQNSSGGTFAVAGTIGQAVAGQTTSNPPFAVNSGFWTPLNLNPTAAGVTLGGRVTTANGAGIRNVGVTLTSADGTTQTVATGAGGSYTFSDVAAGEIYTISVFAKRYRFAQSSQVHSATADFLNINFVAETSVNIPLTPILNEPNH